MVCFNLDRRESGGFDRKSFLRFDDVVGASTGSHTLALFTGIVNDRSRASGEEEDAKASKEDVKKLRNIVRGWP